MSYIIKSLVEAVGPIRPDANVSWGIGQTREVDDSQIEFYRANPAAFTILSGPGYSENSVAGGIVGEIRYFPSAPGAGWLKCDGASYFRSEYPDYESMRPLDAIVVQILGTWPGYDYARYCLWTGTSYLVVKDAASRTVSRSLDGEHWTDFVDALPPELGGNLVKLFKFGTSVLAMTTSTGKCSVSTDDGLSWSAASSLPTPTQTLMTDGYWLDPVLTSGGLLLTLMNTSNVVATSPDGLTWTPHYLDSPGLWHVLVDLDPDNSDVYALDAGTPGRLLNYLSGSVSEFVWFSTSGYYYDAFGFSRARVNKRTVVFSQNAKVYAVADPEVYSIYERSYEGEFNSVQCGAAAPLNGRVVAAAGKNLLVVDPFIKDESAAEVIPDFFPNVSAQDSIGAWNASAGANTEDHTVVMIGMGNIYKLSLDPLKFNAPGLAPKAGASPYVYTGA